jgi:hypothetical protein
LSNNIEGPLLVCAELDDEDEEDEDEEDDDEEDEDEGGKANSSE